MSFKSILYTVVSIAGIPQLIRSIRKKRSYVVLFHGVCKPDTDPNLRFGCITTVQFDNILKWFSEHFDILTPEEYFEGKKGLLITFDDGFLNNFNNALPIMEKYNAPGLFFISSVFIKNQHGVPNFIEQRYTRIKEMNLKLSEEDKEDIFYGMGEDILKQFSKSPLIYLGAHSDSHPYLSQVHGEKLEQEIVGSKKYLESLVGQEIKYFAYPYGDYSKETMEVCARNFDYTFAVKSEQLGNEDHEIPRIGIYSDNRHYLNAKMI